MSTLTETCGCGATFNIASTHITDVRRAADEWRTSHQHTESVGICSDRPPPLMVGEVEIARPYCVLKAGHAGMHSDGEGHWTHGDQRPKNVDWSRVNHGICPKCEQIKFIGHGPLCVDCFGEMTTTEAREETTDGAE